MNVLRAYVVDDEPLAVDRLTRMLAGEPSIELVGSATDPAEAVEFLSRQRVDVLFLDIEMPGLNGFQLLARLGEQPFVIFTTAYDQYALKAFEVNSIDYLLKPVDAEHLRRALGKVERLSKPAWMQQPAFDAVLRQFADSLRGPVPRYPERIASRVGERVHLLELDGVTHFLAQDKLTYAVSNGKNYPVEYTITDLEQKLDPKRFVRIHRSVLLNLAWVAEVNARFGGQMYVALKDDAHTRLAVARDRMKAFKDRLDL